tara:strand:+ start:203 stop:418 length:216 start_codon:yes stop_codon:yes gene_type:complete
MQSEQTNINQDYTDFDISLIENHISLKEEEAKLKVQRAKILNNFLSRSLNLVLVITTIFAISVIAKSFITY